MPRLALREWWGKIMKKKIIEADVPESGGPPNLCIRYGDMIYVFGLAPFDAEFSAKLRAARASNQPLPPFPNIAFNDLVRMVMDNSKKLVEAAGSHMVCLIKVVVWLKDQSQQDRIYRGYFSSQEAIPARSGCKPGARRSTAALRSRSPTSLEGRSAASEAERMGLRNAVA